MVILASTIERVRKFWPRRKRITRAVCIAGTRAQCLRQVTTVHASRKSYRRNRAARANPSGEGDAQIATLRARSEPGPDVWKGKIPLWKGKIPFPTLPNTNMEG